MNREDRLDVIKQLKQIQANQETIYRTIVINDRHTFYGAPRFLCLWLWRKIKGVFTSSHPAKPNVTK